jgi:hypothetical protein
MRGSGLERIRTVRGVPGVPPLSAACGPAGYNKCRSVPRMHGRERSQRSQAHSQADGLTICQDAGVDRLRIGAKDEIKKSSLLNL